MKQIEIYKKKMSELSDKIDFETLQLPMMVEVYEQDDYDRAYKQYLSIEDKIWQYRKLIMKAMVK